MPVVVMVAQGGKAGFFKERSDVIAGVPEGRRRGLPRRCPRHGRNEARATSRADRGSRRTSVSQTNLILGQPVISAQLRDLRTVIHWLQSRKDIDGKKVAVWGDSFAKVNDERRSIRCAARCAKLAAVCRTGWGIACRRWPAVFEENVLLYVSRRIGFAFKVDLWESPYLYLPHEFVLPMPGTACDETDPTGVGLVRH